MDKYEKLLSKVKANLIIDHEDDDKLLLGFIHAAVDYAEEFQNVKYGRRKFPPSTEQAIILLATHFYESRDGGSGGFMTTAKGSDIMTAVDRLLSLGKAWHF